MYKIYLLSKTVSSSQPKREIDRKKIVSAKNRQKIQGERRKSDDRRFLLFFCSPVVLCERDYSVSPMSISPFCFPSFS